MDKYTKRHRIDTLYRAREVHLIADPIVRQGDKSLRQIFKDYVLRKIPVGHSSFYRYMRITKEELDTYEERLNEFRDEQIRKIMNGNRRLRERRHATDCDESGIETCGYPPAADESGIETAGQPASGTTRESAGEADEELVRIAVEQ